MAPTIDSLPPERAAENQSRFRDYNERIESHNAAHHWVDPPYADWVCECARVDCIEPVQLTVAEYESVRADAVRFVVAPRAEHVAPTVEQVVTRHERYWIVEKVGQAADTSEALDSRGRDDGASVDDGTDERNPWNPPAP